MALPWLSTLVGIPLMGFLLILALPKDQERLIRGCATGITLLALGWGLVMTGAFRPWEAGFQFDEQYAWIPPLQVSCHLGLDGISLGLVLLTLVLSCLACIGSWSIPERQKEYFALFLLLEVGMLGTFVALDLFLFYVFWEIVLVPMYFLIGIWGGGRREYSAIKFFLFTLAGSLSMLLGLLAVYLQSHPRTFDLVALAQQTAAFPLRFQQVVFLAFFFGFAVKVPIVPLHTWLPDAHVDAPTPISVLLAGVLLKMGGYGFYRIAYPLFPDAARWFLPAMAVLAVVNILYGALVALVQTDVKRLIAASSISHMGFVLLGLASGTVTGFSGGLLQMVSHGLITGGLFFLVGVLYDRTHTRDLSRFGGLGVRMPVFAGLFTFFGLASLGLPGLSGFVAEFLALLGAFPVHRTATILAVFGVVLAAAYILYMVQRVLLGPLAEAWKQVPEINRRELVTLVPLLLAILAIGLYPLWILEWQGPALSRLASQLAGVRW